MARLPRWIPEHSLVEISCRCIQGRFLLRPSDRINRLFVGVLAKALAGTGILLHVVVALSGHYHLLATVPSTGILARAMRFFQGNLSKEVGRLHRWRGKLWATRYHASIVDDDEATQVARLEYLLSNGCKEDLVWRPEDWPGVNCVRAVLEGIPLAGTWVSRKSQWAAKNRKGADTSDAAHSEEASIDFHPLPCWRHLSPEKARERFAEVLARVEEETRARHRENGTSPLGPAKVKRMHPHHCPEKLAWSPQPLILALHPRRRWILWWALASVIGAYYDASERLRGGNRNARFPPGTFPPALPYVPTSADLRAGA